MAATCISKKPQLGIKQVMFDPESENESSNLKNPIISIFLYACSWYHSHYDITSQKHKPTLESRKDGIKFLKKKKKKKWRENAIESCISILFFFFSEKRKNKKKDQNGVQQQVFRCHDQHFSIHDINPTIQYFLGKF